MIEDMMPGLDEFIRRLDVTTAEARMETSFALENTHRGIAEVLQEFAVSFRNTGNSYMANALEALSAQTAALGKKWQEIQSHALSERLNNSMKTSVTILEAALAGATMASRSTDEKGDRP